MADKNFIVKNGLEVGGQEVVSSSGVVTSAALGGQTLASTDSPTFANLTVSNDLAVSGDLNLTGDLNITGDVNSLSVTDLDVTDQTITLGAGQVESASGGSGIVVDGSGASILWDETNDVFDFNKGVTSTGNVGIGAGATSPSNLLHVQESQASSTLIYFKNASATAASVLALDTGGTGTNTKIFDARVGGTSKFMIYGNGTAEIARPNNGDGTPLLVLSGPQGIMRLGDGQADNGGPHGIQFDYYGVGGVATDGMSMYYRTDPEHISFEDSTGINGNKVMVIERTGNVGIGTDEPDFKLHVNGTNLAGGIFVEDSSAASSSPIIKVQGKRSDANKSQSFSGGLALEALYTGGLAPDTKHIGTIYFGTNHTDGTAANIAYSASISGILEGDANSATDMPTGLVFYTGDAGTALGTSQTTYGTERMRIDHDGQVGINVNDPSYKLHTRVTSGNNRSIIVAENTGSGSQEAGITVKNSAGEGRFVIGGSDHVFIENATEGKDLRFLTFPSGGSTFTEAMRILHNGRVGIGTDNPTRRLTLSGTSTEYINIVGGTTSGVGLLLGDTDAEIRGAIIYDNSNDTLVFRAGGNVTRALVGSNRFEIDPTNDRYKFTYDGTSYNEGLRMAPHSNGYSVLVLGAGTGDSGTVEGQWTLARHPDSADNKLTLKYFDTSDFAWEILKTGEVGFGGTPAAGVTGTGLKLETIDDTNSAYTSTGSTGRLPAGLQISTRNSHNANDSLSGIAMQSSGSGGGTMGGYIGMLPSATYSSPKMVFGLTSGSSAWREDIRILGVDGTKRHVGIGNTNPSEELHVSTATGGVTRIRIDSTSSARNNYIGCTNYDELVLAADEDNEGLNSEIAFRVDGTEKLKINDDGNLGLGGINPGSWNSIWQVIEGGLASTYSGFVAFQTNANDMKLGTNVYHDGNFRYRHDGNGIFVELNREDFVINFVPTGTADSVISFDEAFRLNKTTGVDFVVKRIHLTQTADQSITEGGTIYANFGSQSHIDTDTFTHSTSTNSDNITVDRAGLYQIIGNFVFINAAASARNTVRVSVRVNGVTQNTTASFDYDRGSSYGEFSNNKINTIIDLNANDVIDFEVFGQNIDGTCSLDASFTEVIMTRIGKSG